MLVGYDLSPSVFTVCGKGISHGKTAIIGLLMSLCEL